MEFWVGPCDQRVEGTDVAARLADRFQSMDHRPGILRWLVEGAQRYLETRDLTPPAAILDGVQEYKDSSNPLSEFYEDCCAIDPGYRVQRSNLWKQYVGWVKENGVKQLSKRRFFDTVGAEYELNRVKGYESFNGIALTSDESFAGAGSIL